MQQNLGNKVSKRDFLQSFSETELNKTLELSSVQIKSNSTVPKGGRQICKVHCVIHKKVSTVDTNLPQVKPPGIYISKLPNRGSPLIDRTKHTYYTQK